MNEKKLPIDKTYNKEIPTTLGVLVITVFGIICGLVIVWVVSLVPDATISYELKDPVVIDTDLEWQTYQNEEYSYEFKMPSNWDIYAAHGADPYTNIAPAFDMQCDYDKGDRCLSIGVGVYANQYVKNKKLKDYFNFSTTGSLPDRIISEKEIQIDGEKALAIEFFQDNYYYGGADEHGIVRIKIIVIHNEKVYSFLANERGKDQKQIITSDEWKYKELFDQIISTFKFSDSTDTSNWQVYRNEEYGFEIEYPRGLKRQTMSEGDYCFSDGNLTTANASFCITAQKDIGNLSIEEWKNINLGQDYTQHDTYTLDNQEALIYASPSYVPATFYYIAIKNNTAYRVSDRYGDIESILSTFKFITCYDEQFCGTDGRTYNQFCFSEDSEVQLEHMGKCVVPEMEWDLYKNNQYKFQLKIPAIVKEKSSSENGEYWVLSDDSYLGLAIEDRKFNPADEIPTPWGGIIPEKVDIKPGLEVYEYGIGDACYFSRIALIPKNDIIIVLSFSGESCLVQLDQILSYKEEILSSIKFLD